MYAQLGDVVFEGLKGFTSFGKKEEQVIAEHQLIEGKPRLQDCGEKADELTIGVRINSQFADPKKEYETLSGYRKDATSLPLLDGKGQFFGEYILKSIELTVNNVTPDGEWVEIDLTLTLLENYYTDSLKEAQSEVKNGAFANVNNMPSISSGTIPVTGQSALISSDIQSLSTGATSIGNNLTNAEKFVDKASTYMNNASTKIGEMNSKISGVQQKLTDMIANQQFVVEAGNLLTQLGSFQSSLNALAVPLSLHDLQSALGLNISLQSQIGGMMSAAAPFANATTTLQ